MSETIDDVAEVKPRTKTIEVSPPITTGGKTYNALELKVPSFGVYQLAQRVLKGTPESSTEFMVAIIEKVSGWPADAVRSLDADIVLAAYDFVSQFLEAPETADDAPVPVARSKTIEINPAVTAAGETYTALDLRPPTLNEYQQAQRFLRQRNPEEISEFMMQLVQRVSGWKLVAIKMLDTDVVLEAFDYCSGFIVPPKKGEAVTS